MDTFPSTHWTLILDNSRRRECLEELASKYWTAIYLYARKLGYDEEKAKDITQDFFVEMQKGNLLEKADPERGKFRSFLIGVLKNLCKRDWNQQKKKPLCTNFAKWSLESSLQPEWEKKILTTDISPEEAFHKEWARLIVNQAMSQLRNYCRKSGKPEKVKALEAFELQYFEGKKNYPNSAKFRI